MFDFKGKPATQGARNAPEDDIARFHREAESVAKLGHHPNIVPVYDILGDELDKFKADDYNYGQWGTAINST